MKTSLIFLSFIASTSFLIGQTTDFATRSVSIFKDGSSFVVKSGAVKVDKRTFSLRSDNVPQATFGTLWLSSPTNELKTITAFMDTIKKEVEINNYNLTALLKENKGKSVILYDDKSSYEGVIVGFLDGTAVKAEEEGFVASASDGWVQLQTPQGKWLTLRKDKLLRADFLEKPNALTRTQKTQKPVETLNVEFTTDKATQPLDMMYLQKGIYWTPFYLLELTGEKKGKLTLRTDVVNEVEDIQNANVNFVVGVPNFKDTDALSALVNFGNRGILNEQGWTNGIYSNDNKPKVMAIPQHYQSMSNGSHSYDASSTSTDEESTFTSEVEGNSVEDLFFYTLPNVNLKKHARGQFQLFSYETEIEHVYECNLQANENKSYGTDYSFTPTTQNPVYHSIKIKNLSTNPWTTAAIMVVSKTQDRTDPICQDMMTYTPVKGTNYIKITSSPDIRVKDGEKEASRSGEIRVAGKKYAVINVEGQIVVNNYKNTEVKLNLRRNILGDLQQSDVNWLKETKVNSSANKLNQVCWEISLKGGEEKTIKYSYKTYLRIN